MPQPIQKQRQSNIELLRLFAMFLIITIHANFFALGRPTPSLLEAHPIVTGLRYVLQSTCIIGVNLFILISGYFGIRTRLKSILGFLFTVLFYALLMLAIVAGYHLLTTGHTGIGWEKALSCLRIITKYNWFVPAYLGLMLLAPILNAFVEKASRHELGLFILCFGTLSVYVGFFAEAAPDYGHGHSILQFMLIYLIGRYLKLYPSILNRRERRTDLFHFLLMVLLNSAIAIARIRTPFHPALFTIDNPLVIYASVCFFLYFTKLHIQSNRINFLAAGAFAPFLIQMHPLVYPLFRLWMQYINKVLTLPVFLPAALLTLLLIFFFGIFCDVIRRNLWRRLSVLLPQ